MTDKTVLARLTAELVSSYVGNRSLSEVELDHAIERLPALIGRVHEALLKIVVDGSDEATSVGRGDDGLPVEAEQPGRSTPSSVPVGAQAQTVFPDRLICLEDGLPFKTLKRHLAAHHGLTPEQYRQKWNLPADYPMAAPAYAESRAAIAKKIGLGASGRGGKPAIMIAKGAARKPSRRRGSKT